MRSIIPKEIFEVHATHGPFYTGGHIQWSKDGQYIFCQKQGMVSIVSVNKDTAVTSYLGESNDNEEDTINTFTLCNDDVHIITHHKSSLFKLWTWKDNKLIKLWKSMHKGPVVRIAHCSERNLMISGSSDGIVKLWDLERHACINNLKGVTGVVSVLAFHPIVEKNLVFAVGDDFKIHGWNIVSGKEEMVLSGHFSKVTSLSFHKDGNFMISSGRDRVLILWNISTALSVRVLPVYEEMEDTFVLSRNISLPVPVHDEKDICVAAAGEKGIVRIWEMRSGREIYAQKNSISSAVKEGENLSITRLLHNDQNNTFAVVTVDHNIIVYSLETFECLKQLVGYSDEILDIVYLGEDQSHIAVATNSCNIKLYKASNMNCELLYGHTDIVLSLATTPANAYLLISSAKDNSVRVWLMSKETAKVSCIASATRHTASVGSIAISQMSTKFFASVSQDSCLKLWNLANALEVSGEACTLNVVHTVLAHQKDINSVTISPNDKLIATGSQDKTAKLWSADDLQLLGVFNEHRRGVWCVRFSPIDQVLLTTSADCTIRLWSLTELNCLKTLEGHESSVLKAEFLTHGMQLITASGDGLLKLWSIKTSECLCTMEQHADRVWTLAVSKDEKTVISGGSDSLIVVWKDVTEERKRKVEEEAKQLALEEQQLRNLLEANKLSSALILSLKLERPMQVLKIVESILKTSNYPLMQTISELKPVYKEKLLKCATTWNANSKNCQVAQVVINALMMDLDNEEFQTKSSFMLESMIPYTERHYSRLTKLLQNLHLFNYTSNCIKPHIVSIDSKGI
ncbi:transducin beta-like protein 3 isoform X1 [Colletes latitarsis]|uniref:transducin beta-like protein 3 isoform X1 n=2 Tax=Colletes latitarsis TaxID=2605962 RepID=UPI0040359A95